MSTRIQPEVDDLHVTQQPKKLFAYWTPHASWPAIVAGRLGKGVDIQEIESIQAWQRYLHSPCRTCLLLATDVAPPTQLYRCVRQTSEFKDVLILVAGQQTESEIAILLCEAGAHGLIQTAGELLSWTKVIHKFLGRSLDR